MKEQKYNFIIETIIRNLFFILLIFISFITLFVIASPRVRNIFSLRANLNSTNAKIKDLTTKQKILSQTSVSQLDKNILITSKLLPSNHDILSIYTALDRYSRDKGVKIDSISSPLIDKSTGTARVTVKLSANQVGGAQNILSNHLISSGRLMNIEGIEYDALSNQLVLKLYFPVQVISTNTKSSKLERLDSSFMKKLENASL